MIAKVLTTIFLAGGLTLTGCSLAPKYERPQLPVNDTWPADILPDASLTSGDARSIRELGWKKFFKDPHLQNLIALALHNNRDLRVAALNIEKLRGAYRIQRATLLPRVDISGSYEDRGTFSHLAPGEMESNVHASSLSVGITSFEIDFFGRLQSLKNEALENFLATEEAWRSARLALISDVATYYLALVADRERLAISNDTLKSQNSSYEIIKRKYEAGVASELELRQAQTSVEQARVNIAQYSGLIAQDMNALSLLVGSCVKQEMLPAMRLEDIPAWPEIPVGMPSQVLLLRPDVISAEHALKAANANIGAARANFFPRISLTMGLSTASAEMGDLFNIHTGAWRFLPSVQLPIFSGGSNVATLRVSEANKKIAVAQYERTIQGAFREVADGLALRVTLNQQLKAQQSLTFAASEAYRLSSARYEMGIENYLNVLDSERAMFHAQLALVGVRQEREVNIIALYKALGGGAEDADPEQAYTGEKN